MASHIWSGGRYPKQETCPDRTRIDSDLTARGNEAQQWLGLLSEFRGIGLQTIIAKGNIIEGVEAKT